VGSFAGSPGGRLWVDEVVIQKADGERSAMIVDAHTHIEAVPEPPGATAPLTTAASTVGAAREPPSQ